MRREEAEKFMRLALEQAQQALECGEVAVGAVLVRGDEVVAAARNRRQELGSVCAHAELMALDALGKSTGRWQAEDAVLVVTLEPCLMCSAALRQARVKEILFGAFDPDAGGCGGLYALHADPALGGTPIPVTGGVLREECEALLRQSLRGAS